MDLEHFNRIFDRGRARSVRSLREHWRPGNRGTGAVSVDTFNSNPETVAPQGSPQLYFDVRTGTGSTFTNVALKDCDGTTGRLLDVYVSDAWEKFSNVTGPDANGCLSATLTSASTPSISQLIGNGVVFAAALPIEPTNTTVTSSAANNTTTYGQSFTLTATVSGSPAVPVGSVIFKSDGTALGTAKTLSAGKASLNVTKISAGTHAITAVYTPAAGANFSGSTSSPALNEVVNKATLAIRATNQSGTYGGKLPALTWNATFAGGDTAASLTTQPTCTTTAKTTSGKITGAPGKYPITCSGAVDANYNISFVAGTLTVTKVSLVIKSASEAGTYGGKLPALAWTAAGFVNGDSPKSLTKQPTCTTTAKTGSGKITSPAGTYTIICSGAVDPNYSISYTSGKPNGDAG